MNRKFFRELTEHLRSSQSDVVPRRRCTHFDRRVERRSNGIFCRLPTKLVAIFITTISLATTLIYVHICKSTAKKDQNKFGVTEQSLSNSFNPDGSGRTNDEPGIAGPTSPIAQISHKVDIYTEITKNIEELSGLIIDEGRPNELQLTFYGTLKHSKADPTDLIGFSAVVQYCVKHLPKEFFAKMRINKVILCRELTIDNKPIGAFVDFDQRMIYFDVEYHAESKFSQIHNFYHEFYHFADWVEDGIIHIDDDWNALNEPNFSYGMSAGAASSGFLSDHSKTKIEEDKAEYFSYMMTSYFVLSFSSDMVVRGKINNMKEELEKYSSKFNTKYWNQLSALVEREKLDNTSLIHKSSQ